MKVVINRCYGGFSLSHEAVMAYAARKGVTLYPEVDPISLKHYGEPSDLAEYDGMLHYYTVPPEQYHALEADVKANDRDYKRLNESGWYWSQYGDAERDDPDLVAVIEELGERANGRYAKLAIVEIPDGIEYEIDEYDGIEHIAEKHRTWAS